MATVAARIGDVYRVPRRFGTRSLLLVTGLFAVCLGLVRWAQLPPAVPIFYAVFLSLIAVSQMIFDGAPRLASIATGMVYLPVCFVAEPTVRAHFQFSHVGEHVLMLTVAGGFLAYLGGTLAAGVFLVGDLGHRCWRRSPIPASPPSPSSAGDADEGETKGADRGV